MKNGEVKWILREVPPGCENLTPGGMPAIVGLLLAQRGVTAEGVESFLQPRLAELSDPFAMTEMELAVVRVFQAVDRGEKICIYGDYDVDGVTSITLMTRVLAAYGVTADAFIPRRSSEGYGLSTAGIARCLEENGKPDLMIAVDCGTVSNGPIAELNGLGVDVVVLDHHEMGLGGRPDCVALVNPKAGGDPCDYLCAAGVVFKLAHALLKRRPVAEFDLREVLDLVAVATVADIVPLVGENRLLVRHGLNRLSRSTRPGLMALQQIAGVNGAVTSQDVGFRIGPRLNAAGRMDRPEDALETLLTDCPKAAAELSKGLEGYNQQRQKLERDIHSEALAQLAADSGAAARPVIVVGSRSWHPGVVGVVASRLMRAHHKPAFVIAFDENGCGKASGRSVTGVSLVEAIEVCRHLLLAGGGHHMAAGLSIEENRLEEFREAFSAHVTGTCSAADLEPRIHLDAEVSLADLSLEFLDRYELLQPFGSCNPQPLFMARQVWLSEEPRALKDNHLKLLLHQDGHERDAIFFGGGASPLPEPPWDIAFTIDRNTFRGHERLQISLQAVRSSQ